MKFITHEEAKKMMVETGFVDPIFGEIVAFQTGFNICQRNHFDVQPEVIVGPIHKPIEVTSIYDGMHFAGLKNTETVTSVLTPDQRLHDLEESVAKLLHNVNSDPITTFANVILEQNDKLNRLSEKFAGLMMAVSTLKNDIAILQDAEINKQ